MPPQETPWSAIRRKAQPWVSFLAETDITATAALDILRGEGFGYRMTNFFADWRRYKGIGIQSSYVKRLDPSSSVPRSWMVETPGEIWHIPEAHKGVFTCTFSDPDTGDMFQETFTPGFLRELSKGDATRLAEEWFSDKSCKVGYDYVSTELIGWMHKVGELY